MDRQIKIGCVYKHFKGTKYKVVSIAKHTETEELMIIYHPVDDSSKMWVRPVEVFMSEVDHEKYPDVKQKYRFELVTKVKLVEDEKFKDLMLQRVKDNGGYCPCMLVKDETTKCMCKAFREQEEGVCHCGLYYKEAVI